MRGQRATIIHKQAKSKRFHSNAVSPLQAKTKRLTQAKPVRPEPPVGRTRYGRFKVVTNPGEMAEWLKAHAWKACLGETLTWVRIPLSPPPYNPCS